MYSLKYSACGSFHSWLRFVSSLLDCKVQLSRRQPSVALPRDSEAVLWGWGRLTVSQPHGVGRNRNWSDSSRIIRRSLTTSTLKWSAIKSNGKQLEKTLQGFVDESLTSSIVVVNDHCELLNVLLLIPLEFRSLFTFTFKQANCIVKLSVQTRGSLNCQYIDIFKMRNVEWVQGESRFESWKRIFL